MSCFNQTSHSTAFFEAIGGAHSLQINSSKILDFWGGRGLLFSIRLKKRIENIEKYFLENSLKICFSEKNIVPIMPPLIITDNEINEMMDKIKKSVRNIDSTIN